MICELCGKNEAKPLLNICQECIDDDEEMGGE